MATGESMKVNVSELSQVVSGIEQIEIAAGDTILISTQERLNASVELSIENKFDKYLPSVNVIILPPTAHIEAIIRNRPNVNDGTEHTHSISAERSYDCCCYSCSNVKLPNVNDGPNHSHSLPSK